VATEVVEQSQPGALARTGAFLREVRGELRKVTWPTREELRKATVVIVIFVSVLGLLIGWMDWLLQTTLVTGVARLFR
jgi:preprotein translocase subunit SecE